jgi:lipid-binding SYLF domain-containing protein
MLVCALLLNAGAATAQIKLEDNVDQAVTILEHFREIPEQAIPEAVMRDAKGLPILTVLKGGFVFSGQDGARSRRRSDGASRLAQSVEQLIRKPPKAVTATKTRR